MALEIEVDVSGAIKGLREPEDENASSSNGALIQIEFVLENALRVVGYGQAKCQCCYEKKTVPMSFSLIDNIGSVEDLVYQTLFRGMSVDSGIARKAMPVAAKKIKELVLPTRFTNPCFKTVLLEIRIECFTTKLNREKCSPLGEHGYNRLLQRVEKEVCDTCEKKLNVPSVDIVVTPCHHVYHRSCIFQLLDDKIYLCPVCYSDLRQMVRA